MDESRYLKSSTNFSDEKLNLQIVTNRPQIKIYLKDVNYTIDKAGINIIVWDKKKEQIIDRVSFAPHISQSTICYRENKSS